jgi:hypothetical protein
MLSSTCGSVHEQNEKATRQQGGLFFLGRIVPTEAKPSKLSGQNLMGRKSRVSSSFWEINVFIFNELQNQSISGIIVPI